VNRKIHNRTMRGQRPLITPFFFHHCNDPPYSSPRRLSSRF